MAAARPGTLAGTVVDSHGQAVAGVCVTAFRTAVSWPNVDGRSAVTSAVGMFMITGLHAGPYSLRYRNCLGRPADGVVSQRAAALGTGPLAASATATRGYVTGGRVTTLGRITLRSRAAGQPAGLPIRPVIRRVTASQLRQRSSGQRFGGIAGRVVGPHGRPIKGLCFSINSKGWSIGSVTKADGRYSTGKTVPPGTYTVDFSAACDFRTQNPTANWATEWYNRHLQASAADPVVVKAGKITRGIGGVMVRGG